MATTIIKSANSDNQAIVDDTGHLLVTGSAGNNASVASTGTTAPTSATEIAGIDPDGNLKAVSIDAHGFINVNGVSTEAGLHSFQTSQYSILTTASQLAPTPLANRSSLSITISAPPNTPVYIGNSSAVTTSNGYPLYDKDSIQLDLTPAGQVWAICASGSPSAAVMEIA